MAKLIQIIKFVLTYDWFPVTGQLYIAPLVIPGIMAGLGALGNVLGESEEEKRNRERKAMIDAYLKRIQANNELAEKNMLRSDRSYSGKISERRGNYSDTMEAKGLDVLGSNYSNEKSLINANVADKENITSSRDAMNAELNANVDQLNAGMEDTGFGTKLRDAVSGGVKGFNLGAGISGALKELPGGGTGTKTTTNNPLNLSSTPPAGYVAPRLSENTAGLQINSGNEEFIQGMADEWFIDENGELKQRKRQ